MSARISPIVSEFETEEQAASYDKWFRAQVQASINDPAANIPHDQVMAEMRALLESKCLPESCKMIPADTYADLADAIPCTVQVSRKLLEVLLS
ncbi:hypothetical protein PSCFBP3800_04317 [Pseudomonas syringae group genomosp. 3]|uniref:Stability determinant domain-containing protein n=2 Tax=Pseudomonas syringae group TaxID=136849 RepID=A0A3M2WSZ0_PSEA0|nr:hypothetical protein PSYMP_25610 [Pseudomonas amygdali pv. morsprunorum str. M302280]RML54557.1 hypothetical protein ALQ94_01439 [Pseudomonas amygdali pv. morsprunorum]SOS35538.1 hypothetical protein CFBP6411_04181 [Pseudomonas syringae group genomosp. 3]SPF19773.1 hypothetical protein PSCFBP3800_04317 [Pseudomonas syringae group genomosp. 3]